MVARVETPNAITGKQYIEKNIHCCYGKYCREKVFPLLPEPEFIVEAKQQRHCYRRNQQYDIERHKLILKSFDVLLDSFKNPAKPYRKGIRVFCNIRFQLIKCDVSETHHFFGIHIG